MGARRLTWLAAAGGALVLTLGACGSASDSSSSKAGAKAGGGDAPRSTVAEAKAMPTRCDWDMNTVSFWKANPAMEFSSEHAHGHGQGNEHGAQAWVPISDPEQCATLQRQIDRMQAVTARYPTLQDALDAKCFRATTYIPGIASHLYCLANRGAGTDIDNPTMLLYGGNAPEAPIVGLSYMVYQETPPNEDPGVDLWVKYMPWHYHQGLCIKGGLVIGGDNSDKASCEARGGRVQGRTGWMGHYWMPSCPSPDGVFSAANPRLDMAVGVFNDANASDPSIQGAPCQGSAMKVQPARGDRFGRPAGMHPHHGLDHAGMDHGEMDHGEMDHGEMDHGEMDHGEHSHGGGDEGTGGADAANA